MTSQSLGSKGSAARYSSGPKAIGTLLPKVTRAAFRKQMPAGELVLTDWPIIVGPSLAASAIPRRLAAGTLTLGCAGPVALELQHLALPLIERINQHLGRAAVTRLRFVSEVLSKRESGQADRPRREPVEIAGMPKGALREALSNLGAKVRSDPA